MRKILSLLAATTVIAGIGSQAATATATNRLPGPASFASQIDNPWFPLKPGTVFVYRGVRDGEPARDVLTVTHRTRTIQGVRAAVIDDKLYLRGRLAERTTDWYAQDKAGNVWYLGEQTATFDTRGKLKSTNGTFLAGVNGAQAGIYMPAHPTAGQTGQQEYYEGHAEDQFKILNLSTPVRTPGGSSNAALLTQETTPLEPGVIDHKTYVRGIGTVKEEAVKGGNERLTLSSIRHL